MLLDCSVHRHGRWLFARFFTVFGRLWGCGHRHHPYSPKSGRPVSRSICYRNLVDRFSDRNFFRRASPITLFRTGAGLSLWHYPSFLLFYLWALKSPRNGSRCANPATTLGKIKLLGSLNTGKIFSFRNSHVRFHASGFGQFFWLPTWNPDA